MPGTDGFEICLQLKQDERTREIPVIFMTALSDEINKVRGFEVGGVDYLTKPLHYQETLIRIETHLNMQKLQQQLRSQNIQLEQQNVRLQQEISERKQTEKELKTYDPAHRISKARMGINRRFTFASGLLAG
jgi:PleD family two-component response regulator